MKRTLTFLAAATLALSAAAGPVVGDLTLNGFEFSPTPSGTLRVTGESNVTAGVGAIRATFDDGVFPEDYLVYCIELFAPAGSFGSSFGYTSNTDPALSTFGNTFTLTQEDRLRKLFVRDFGLTGGVNADSTASAAIQLAVWEIMYENGSSLNVGAGDFKTNSASLSAASLAANSLLAGLDAQSTDGFVVDFTSFNQGGNKAGFQDFIAVRTTFGDSCEIGNDVECFNDVPEPGTFALAGLSLLGLALSRRRKV
jgi:hypothetical protein